MSATTIDERELQLMAMDDNALLDVVNRSLETMQATERLDVGPREWLKRTNAMNDLDMARTILNSRM